MRHWIYHKYHHYNDFIVITKQEKGTYFLSIRILSDPNKVYLYLTLTLHNFTLPKNLHLSYLPHLRVLSIHIAFEQGIFGVPLGNFFQFLLSIVFSCNKLLLSRSVTCHKLNNIYFKFKQKNLRFCRWHWKTANWKCENIFWSRFKILQFFKIILQFEHCFPVTNWYFHSTLLTHESNYFYFI